MTLQRRLLLKSSRMGLKILAAEILKPRFFSLINAGSLLDTTLFTIEGEDSRLLGNEVLGSGACTEFAALVVKLLERLPLARCGLCAKSKPLSASGSDAAILLLAVSKPNGLVICEVNLKMNCSASSLLVVVVVEYGEEDENLRYK
jgi:hypothetical protein